MKRQARMHPLPETGFSADDHGIWRTLFERQLPRVRRWACREYLDGWELLALRADRIPSIDELNAQIAPRTGWKTVQTSVRYTDAAVWYRHFARREFLVTDYLRSWRDLVFTPEPDLFHDIFGHLPFLTLPHYAALEEMFAPAFLGAGEEHREEIKRLAWYTTEFGLLEEEGELKAFGAGLISSIAELESVMTGGVKLLPFSVENAIRYGKSVWSHNEVIFVIESIAELVRQLEDYFAHIGQNGATRRPTRSRTAVRPGGGSVPAPSAG